MELHLGLLKTCWNKSLIMKRQLTPLIFLIFVFNSFSQKVFIKPDDYVAKTGLAFSEVRIGSKYINTELSENLHVIDAQGNRNKIRKDSVWGYQTKEGKTYRFRESNSIQLIDDSSLCIYEFTSLYWSSYFFSVTLGGETYRLNRRNLLRASNDKTCLLEILNVMKSEGKNIKARLKDSNQFYLNKLLSESSCKPF